METLGNIAVSYLCFFGIALFGVVVSDVRLWTPTRRK